MTLIMKIVVSVIVSYNLVHNLHIYGPITLLHRQAATATTFSDAQLMCCVVLHNLGNVFDSTRRLST